MKPPDRGLLPAVPLLALLALVLGSFFVGQWSQQLHVQKQPVLVEAPTIDDSRHLTQQHRDLRASKATNQGPSLVYPPTDPLETADLERFMLEGSGLTKVRPPIPAAPSGDNFLRVIPMQILSWYPRLVVYPAFIDPARCKQIIRIANRSLYKSALAVRPGEKVDFGQDVRTSSGTYLTAGSEGRDGTVLAWLEERLAAASLLPAANGEAFNVLRYEPGQHYDSHMDSFDPKEYGAQPSQRMATFLIYLSDPQDGGETIFKREGLDGTRVITNWRGCDDGIGLKYKPRQGDAVLFHSLFTNGDIDPQALHGGCAVSSGEKWVATKWIRTMGASKDRAADLDREAHRA